MVERIIRLIEIKKTIKFIDYSITQILIKGARKSAMMQIKN